MDWLFQLLFGLWYHSHDGRTKAADAGDRYLVPVLLLALGVGLVVLLVIAAR